MKTKDCRKIALLLFVSIITSLFPTSSIAAITDSTTLQTSTENTQYSDMFNELTTFINEKVGDDISADTLNNYLEDTNFEKVIAQREFLRKVGAATIQGFVATAEKEKFITWLLDNTEAMTLFLEGGEPDTEYSKAFEVWFEIWTKDTDSHTGYELKLAIASAMKFGNGVPKWYTSRTLVSPYERYEYYKVREEEGRFPVSMKTRTVWELRNTINAPTSNWDLDYIRDVIHAGRYNAESQSVSIWYPPYTATSIYKDKDGNPYSVFSASGDQFFGPDATIKEVHEIGGVCGTESKVGSIVVNSFGIPGFLIGQPGHAAHVYHSPSTYGKWDIGYDVFGWGESGLGENTLVPYTNYNNIFNRVAYWFAYEESRVDEAALHKSYQLKWIADALEGYDKKQSVRKIAMEINKWNIDVWRDYINGMESLWNEAIADTQIPSSKMTVSASSSNANERPEYAIDGNESTIWHTQYNGERSTLPQSITLNFDKEYEISRFSYLPRNSGRNGIITEYNIYTSLDGTNYELLSHGTWENNSSEKVVEFNTVNAKYIKLEALKGNGDFATAAELKVYGSFDNKPISQEEWEELASRIMVDFQEQPEVMYDLVRSIQSHTFNSEISREKYQQYLVKLNSILDKAGSLSWKQKQITDSLKKAMIINGLYLADFSFDGDNSGKLMGSKTDNEYSLDGGLTWKAVTEDNMKLSDEEIASLSSKNGIRVRIVGTNEYILIPINQAPSLPNIYANDDINKIFNMNNNVYYSINNGETWTKYENEQSLVSLSGDLNFMVKIPAQGKTLGSEIKTFNFTSKVDTSLILPSDIVSVTGDAYKDNPISNINDGNIHSFWHSDYEGGAKPLPQSVTFELKDLSNLYKLEYVPRQDGARNGNITEYNIYTSVDGENFTLMSNGKWSDDNTTKTAIFNALNVKYIKFEVVKGVGNFASAAEVKLFKSDMLIPQISFNFDGENAGKLIGTNTSMEYSMDNGETWKEITEVNMHLSSEDFMNLSPSTIIKVRFKNSDKAAEISFASCTKNPNVIGNDIENTITGLDSTMEYSTDEGTTWTRYNGTFNVDLRSNVVLHVRTAAVGTTFAGCNEILNYTTDYATDFKEGVVYKFISKATNKSFDIGGGSGAENASVIQYGYGGGANQIAYLVSVGENQYKIVMKHSGKVLAPQALSLENDTILAQMTYDGSNEQKWKFVKLGDNEYQIINVGTGYAITADNNRYSVRNSKLEYNNNQVWTIDYAYDVAIPDVNFSFDGENAGRIMGTTNSMEYTIDNGVTWKSINTNNILLSNAELDAINAVNGIKVRVKGNAGIAQININNAPEKPNVAINDNLNIIEGINSSMEYSIDYGATWTRYSESDETKFMTDMNVLVRVAGTLLTPPSDKTELKFTAKITTPLYKEFDPMDYIRTKDSEGNDITNSIEILENTVDINKKGIYVLTYKTLDNNNEAIIIKKEVEVVSKADYLSDIDYKTGTCGSGSINKDTNLNSTINEGSIVLNSNIGKDVFKKGITAHANSEIVYDVSDKNYTNFESYIGIDDTAYSKDGSVIFKVYVDEVLQYDSGIVSSKTPYKYVNVDITDAKEVKLIVDSNGTNYYDHSVWADAKFIATDSKPVINATNVSYEIGDTVNFEDILSKVTASDIEDGDLSSKVTYTTDYQEGKSGSFNIVYNVLDSDGNNAEKTVKLLIVNDFIYVSDTEWIKATNGWGSMQKDKTINSKSLILLNGEDEVTYEKGIGVHAHSEITYDLTGKDYGYFTSYVGGDRDGNGNTSVVFKVYVDGELVKETGVMRVDTPQEFIKVNIAGAKELKLVVTDSGNGNGNDGALWGDSKFLTATDNPDIKANVVVKYVDSDGNTLKEDKIIEAINTYDVTLERLEKINVLDKTYNYVSTIGVEKGYVTKQGEEIVVVYTYKLALNKQEMESAINEAKLLNKAEYTEESWTLMEEKLIIAEGLLTNEQATQAEIDEALSNLKQAIAELKKPELNKPVINATNVSYEIGDTVNFEDILSKVTASDIEDGDLSSKVTYTTDYQEGKSGNFNIVYNVLDSDGNNAEKTVKLLIVNDFVYVSDTEWIKATNGWGSMQKDKTINSKSLVLWNGEDEVTYEKGIGVHAHAEITYDLTGKDYGYFTSYVGGDHRDGNGNTSVVFKVYVDGELVKETGVMGKDTPQEFIKVNIAGAKELKLVVTDSGNGNGSDGALWGDSKFLTATDNPDMKANVVVKYVDSDGNALKEDKVIEAINTYDATIERLEQINVLDKTYNYVSTVGVEKGDITKQGEEIVVIYTYKLASNKQEMESVINEAKLLNKAEYTEQSWTVMEEKLIIAESLLSNEQATQVESDEALSNLKQAITALQKNEKEEAVITGTKPVIEAKDLIYDKTDEINFDEILTNVKAKDDEDGDLSSKVTYETDYEKDKTGAFKIKYSVTDSNGNVARKKVELIVSNSVTYASDIDWVTATAQWGTVKKDTSVVGNKLTLWDGSKEVEYEKGIGTHAYSEITYDLTGKNYDYFTSYVGADRTKNRFTSIAYKVYVDGKLVAKTDTMTRKMQQEFIKVNLEGATELKLVVEDGGNGIGSDHAVWADAKFLDVDENLEEIIEIPENSLPETVEKEEDITVGNNEEQAVSGEETTVTELQDEKPTTDLVDIEQSLEKQPDTTEETLVESEPEKVVDEIK